jgi:hypothetical protein
MKILFKLNSHFSSSRPFSAVSKKIMESSKQAPSWYLDAKSALALDQDLMG